MNAADTERPFLAPQVFQNAILTPELAALKCLLVGHGISVDDADLASTAAEAAGDHAVHTLVRIATQFGLAVLPAMLPAAHVLLSAALPTVVTIHPILEEPPHAVVVWNRQGPFIQLMDPKLGRRWVTTKGLLSELHHEARVASRAEWQTADHNTFCDSVRQRLLALRMSPAQVSSLLDLATADTEWHGLARLDAATQMVTSLVQHGGFRRGREAEQAVVRLYEEVQHELPGTPHVIPAVHWTLRSPSPDIEPPASERTDESIHMHGIVLLRVLERLPTAQRVEATQQETETTGEDVPQPPVDRPSDDTTAQTPPPAEAIARPASSLLYYLRQDGLLRPGFLGGVLVLVAVGVFLQALLFRGLMDISLSLGSASRRLWAIACMVAFAILLLALKWLSHSAVRKLGHRLDGRLRMAVLTVMPGLSSQYFQQFAAADMIERMHSVRDVRETPFYGAEFIQIFCQFCFTIIGLAWIDWLAAFLSLLKIVVPFIMMHVLGFLAAEDLRTRTYAGYISRFYFDAMQGLMAIRTHGAERSTRREYESLLVRWARNLLNNAQRQQWLTFTMTMISRVLTALMILLYVVRGKDSANLILLTYWTLQLENVTNALMYLLFLTVAERNRALRFLQLLQAPLEQEQVAAPNSMPRPQETAPSSPTHGVTITLQQVNVRVAEQMVLRDINVTFDAGSQIAIVGPSGAGKSTLVGLLLGWHYPATGQVLIDGAPRTYTHLQQLRRETAWVDPTIQLWNRSFLYNVRYGGGPTPLHQIIEQADLRQVLERLPQGMQTRLGGEGRLVSGGEGQRIRFGRAMQRRDARLVIMDEPFRALDREMRRTLLARAQTFWSAATLICITHDVGQTQSFARVLVLDGGRIVEDDTPSALLAQPTSRYRQLIEAEDAVRETLWSSEEWRRLWLENGQLRETSAADRSPRVS